MKLIEDRYESDTAFEKAFGLTPKTVNNWKRGVSKSYYKMLPKLAEHFEVSTDYILACSDSTDADVVSNVRSPYSKMVSIPLLSRHDAVCCGSGFSYDDIQHDVEGMILIPEEDLFGHPTAPMPIYAVYADGDSMEPLIKDGERYVINPNAEVGEGEIALLVWKGRDLMRGVLYGKDGSMTLRSAKPELYKDILATAEDVELGDLRFKGKVMLKVPRTERVRGVI